jgi:transcriptional regulator with XRE-family HTH domain
MKTRILEFLKAENKSSAQFAEEIGVQPSGISHILSGRNNPSLDFVMKMLGKYPSLSTDWLLFGKGKMYREALLNDLFSAEHDIMDLSMNFNDKTSDISTKQLIKSPPETSDKPIPLKPLEGSGKLKRIVFFYGDGTFNEYIPR